MSNPHYALAPSSTHNDVLGDLILDWCKMPPLPHHVAVDLIDDEHRVVLLCESDETTHLLGGPHATGRVARVAHNQTVQPARHLLLNQIKIWRKVAHVARNEARALTKHFLDLNETGIR